MNSKQTYYLIARYLILFLLGLFFSIFYLIFTPLTIYPSYFILSLFYPSIKLLSNNILSFGIIQAKLIPACIAGAAYYLLLILNLTISMKNKTRIKSILFILLTFLILNILRIVIFSALLVNGYRYFDFTHIFFWYFGSTILVMFIWFANVRIFKINSIPIYSDFKNILKEIKK